MSSQEERARYFFKQFNRFMLLMWWLGLGKWINMWPSVGGRIMVISHTGRKTGLRRRTPVNYVLINGDVYCTAGFGRVSDWYRNIMAHTAVEIWLPDGCWFGETADVSDSEMRLPLMRQVLIASGFAAYLAGINPRAMTDEELDQATADYRLIRIHRTAACTGTDGPGDLAWILPVAAFALLLFWLWRYLARKRSRIHGRG